MVRYQSNMKNEMGPGKDRPRRRSRNIMERTARKIEPIAKTVRHLMDLNTKIAVFERE